MKKTMMLMLMVLLTTAAIAQGKYTTVKNIQYVNSDDTSAYRRERCVLDVYYPNDKQGFKTIVWFHGGGLEVGQKEFPRELKDAGFAIVAPNYRLFPKCKCPEYVQDAAAAVAWVMTHIEEYGGDKEAIYVGGHSAGGYLTLMLALDKQYLSAYGVDADAVKAYFPVSGQTATHYTIRKERGISYTHPIVDKYAPLNNARKLNTKLILYTGDRRLEQMARYEENLYLKAVLEGHDNEDISIYEISGFNHGNVVSPACQLIRDYIRKDK